MQTAGVQAYLINCSFPDTIEGVLALMEKNHSYVSGAYETDLDFVLSASEDPSNTVNWTAPRWAMPGDIVFFYHAGKANHYINQILKSIYQPVESETINHEDFLAYLAYAKKQAQQLGSRIFAVGQVCSEVDYQADLDSDSHFRGRIFVDIENIQLLAKPVPTKLFNQAVKLGQSTITPVCGKDFEYLKELLKLQTPLPDFLDKTQATDRGFYQFSAQSWWLVAASEQTRFLHETQLRSYLADDFLKAIKDPKSPLLEECRTFKGSQATGYADYMIQIGKNWIPVETKLNLLTERDIFSQLNKYQQIESFIVTKGTHKGKKIKSQKQGLCLVIDQKGLYLAKNDQWLLGKEQYPWVKREELNPEKCAWIAEQLHELL